MKKLKSITKEQNSEAGGIYRDDRQISTDSSGKWCKNLY